MFLATLQRSKHTVEKVQTMRKALMIVSTCETDSAAEEESHLMSPQNKVAEAQTRNNYNSEPSLSCVNVTVLLRTRWCSDNTRKEICADSRQIREEEHWQPPLMCYGGVSV